MTQTKRYTRFAVPLNSIAFSEAEYPVIVVPPKASNSGTH
jgi:hypothetical protein